MRAGRGASAGRRAAPERAGSRATAGGAGRAPAAGAKPSAPESQRLVDEVRARREDLSRSVHNLQQYWTRLREWDRELSATRTALADAHSRFGEFYDFVPTPFLVLDGRFRILQANTAGTSLLGGVNGRVVGQPMVAYVDGRDMRPLMALLTRARLDEPARLEVRLRSAEGWIPAHVIVRRGEAAGETRSYYVAIVDLSEVRRLEQERANAEERRQHSVESERAALAAARAKDEFIAMLSHELRTPLTPILAAADALRVDQLPQPVRDAVAIIRRNVVTEARLIDDLLDVARLTTKRFTVERAPVSLHGVLDLVLADWAPQATQAGIDVRLELGATLDRIDADAARIGQVLRNVLGNALKFSHPGGRVTVRTEDADGFVRVCIHDTGAGMTAAQVARLFEPFTESRPQFESRAGLGLGLVISHGIVQAHAGKVRVHSRGRGRGTTVQIDLPTTDRQPETARAPALAANPGAAISSASASDEAVSTVEASPRPAEAAASAPSGAPARADAPVAAAPAAPAPAAQSSRRVLLVEDHEDSAMTLSMVLSMKGYEVRVARTVREAQRLAAECDLMISDISLPDGSGLDLIHDLHRTRPLRAIALSGYGTEEDQRRSREAGFAEHLTKPVDIDHLLAAVDRLAKHQPPTPR